VQTTPNEPVTGIPVSPQNSLSPIRLDADTADAAPPALVCFSHLRWHFVTQRPQHLLTRCARDRRVFFWEEPWFDADENHAGTPTLERMEVAPNLVVLRPHLPRAGNADDMQRALLDTFMAENNLKRFVRWYYTPMALAFTDHLEPLATVYDCMDELTGFLGAPPELAPREQTLFSLADVVFTGGISLYEAKRRQHPNVHAFPSSIEVEHFAQAKANPLEPADQAAIPYPRAGFFGVLDERFDRELVAAVAALRPEVHFVFLGPVVKIDPATLPQAANVHYLGGKSYQELPSYIAHWQVALLPFALNESTRFISPTKTPEYLAAGKPVVSTPIHDVVSGYGNAGLVAIASTPWEFAEAIDRALEPQPRSWHEAVAAKLAQGSWDRTWAAMWREIEAVLHAPHAASHRAAPAPVLPFRMPAVTVRARFGSSRPVRQERFDYLVVGAGLAGAVLAERLANGMGKRVLIVDKRDHIAGNTFDYHDAAGILVHKYGPHIFHTNSAEVVQYLSKFTEWRQFEHRVLASVDGQLLPIPINLDTINRLYGLALDADGMQAFLAARAEKPQVPRTSEDIVVSRVGRELYEKFFRGYTRKQWGLDPSELDASVAGRIPVRFDRDDRYFTDSFQAMPREGYTRMFERMLDSGRIVIRTGVSFRDAQRTYAGTGSGAQVIFTGPIDEYFNFQFGPLPYRSLEFRHQTFDRPRYQSAPVVNFPNDHEYTRVTEFKYLTGQAAPRTSVVFEYPRAEGDPYYPIPRPENAALYARYKELADRESQVRFVGRLATYKYYNMDQVVAQALVTFRRIAGFEEQGVAANARTAIGDRLVPAQS
jgi:UDP-galactopyranose mutase